MKKITVGWVMVLILSAGLTGVCRADDDNRIIEKFDHNGPHDPLRVASTYLVLTEDKADGLPALPAGDETRFYSKVWDDLFLQVTTESGEKGIEGYMFSFSKDEADQDLLTPVETKDVPTLREVSAADFRTDDNFSPRPLRPGPGIPTDRSALRIIHYPGFDVEIRVLEFSIADTKLNEKPRFKSISFLVTVREKAMMGKAKVKAKEAS